MPAGLVVGVLGVSSSAILARYALETAPAVAVAFWRCLGGSLTLAPFAVRERDGRPTGGQLRRMVWSGLLLAVHFALYIGSLELTTVAAAVLLTTMSPVFVAIASARWLDERVGRRGAIGIAVSLAGAVVVALADGGTVGLRGDALLGNVMALGAAVAVSGYLVLGRAVRRDVGAATYSAVVYGVAAAALLATSLLAGLALVGYSRTSWLAILGLLLGPQLLGHTVFNTMLSRVSSIVVSVVALSEPVIATLLAMLLFAEFPGPLFWLGAPVVATGVLLASTRR